MKNDIWSIFINVLSNFLYQIIIGIFIICSPFIYKMFIKNDVIIPVNLHYLLIFIVVLILTVLYFVTNTRKVKVICDREKTMKYNSSILSQDVSSCRKIYFRNIHL